MAEWSIAAVLKTVEGNTSGGSNPSLSANNQSESAVTHKVTADLIFIPYKFPWQQRLQSLGYKCINMSTNKKISLLTLLGLILPLGNIWGPYIIRIHNDIQSYQFRKNLVIFEFFLSLVAFILAVAFSLKGINSGFNPNFFTVSACIVAVQDIIIIITAFMAPFLAQGKFQQQ